MPFQPFEANSFEPVGEVRAAKNSRGFSLVEMAIAMAIILVIAAIAIPTSTRTIRNYRLGSAAISVANILQRARSEAINANRTTPVLGQQVGTQWQLWIELSNPNDFRQDGNEPYIYLPSDMNFLTQGQVPGPATMGYGVNTQVVNGPVSFDSRGTVDFGIAPPVVLLVYLGYTNDPSYGYRAIAITPNGKTKIWRASQGGASWARD